MNTSQAEKILGINKDSDYKAIKQKYRQLMQLVHPDNLNDEGVYPYSAQEINAAYSLLIKNKAPDPKKQARNDATWGAPIVNNAYMERNIYSYAEDADGPIGRFIIANGRYEWTADEEFELFMFSILECSKTLLHDIDKVRTGEVSESIREKYLAELSYLLMQQYVDGRHSLDSLLGGAIKNGIYYTPAMLELSVSADALRENEVLYPSRVSNHRLYISDNIGYEFGYLSFADDRLYHVIIPLFERRLVKVKIRLASTEISKRDKYVNVDLWFRLVDKKENSLESINMKIDALLESYKSI